MVPNSVILDYDTVRFPFKAYLEKCVFKVPRLEKLHVYWARQSGKDALEYQDNMLLRKLMQRLDDEAPFYKIFKSWIYNVLAPQYAMKLSHSQHPKMRVHLAGTGCVSAFHRDANITKRDEQLNVYLPFTDVYDGATVWAEDSYGSDNRIPINLRYGQAMIWDGGFLSHGTVENETDITRVSCDFRFKMLQPEKVDPPYSTVLSGRPSDLEHLRGEESY